jgi:hypothetical protein
MSSWDASSIQLVWFSQQTMTFSAGEVFAKLFGAEPETIRNNRTLTPAAPFSSLASGAIVDGQGQVVISPGRVDVSITPPMTEAGDIIHIKNTPDVLSALVSSCSATVSVPDVYRLALVTTLLSPPVASLSEASAAINERIGKAVPFDDALDVQFQVNRRMTAHFDGATLVNRLLRFSVAVTQQFLVGVVGLGQQVPQASPTSESIGASLAIDLNNVPTGNMLSAEQQTALWQEYLTETLRIRDDGGIEALA